MEFLDYREKFEERHLGPNSEETEQMLEFLEEDSLDSFIDKVVPPAIRLEQKMNIGDALTEKEFTEFFENIAERNEDYRSFIGMGYYPTITPSVIKRNLLENPGWYTQYTPYQAEIAQGRLQALLNFQTMVTDLTGMEIANASLLDESTAGAEAMLMLHSLRKKEKKNAETLLVSDKVFPQTIEVIQTRAEPIGINVKVVSYDSIKFTEDVFGLVLQYPDLEGTANNFNDLLSSSKEKNVFTAVAADLMSLTLLTPPGEWGADVVFGTTQRFGIPMGFGGPHAAYFATKDEYKRQIPGRIIGVSVDSKGRKALRMALQTREQHIKREKATSNICTAQVLLAVMAGMYAAYHGPQRLKNIALKINSLTQFLKKNLTDLGYSIRTENMFDTISISIENTSNLDMIRSEALTRKINFNYFLNNKILISLDEKTELKDIEKIIGIFASAKGNEKLFLDKNSVDYTEFPKGLKRETPYLTYEEFNTYHSETEMMRYLKMLENKDLSLTTSMIALGSCTMKLNAASEMYPIGLPKIAGIHPFVPKDQAAGYFQIFDELEKQLCEVTGFAGVSLQPNSGAQGEYAGLMVIRAYHHNNGDYHRKVILIPSSAHGTNPASATMAGGKVVVVKCDENGNIDIDDLKNKAELNKENLSCLMVTYPSTHGVFERGIKSVCAIIHENGGQVYMDGANMNAQVGLTNPFIIGADVCHLNLHKTFCIPHGGGGPGMGPIGVAEHLVPFLPGHSVTNLGGEKSISAISAAPYGSPSILPISYAYIKMMGEEGLTNATKIAILNANYLRKKLQSAFTVLYTDKNGYSAHELIFDLREYKNTLNIEVDDIAKRLMDYGFHAPTVSFPVPGTIMVEPTESESKAELDRFCDAMLSIKEEIDEIARGEYPENDNVLKNAPHIMEDVITSEWDRPYTQQKAAFPLAWIKSNKFWPAVSRINNVHGDRNLICSCAPISDYEEDN
ncbi:MAG: aminomethyl-transferring glycine dehydrogenase [Melioribacteraceae bacterium]|nr:aminomethyl-transferring glycine dehydrogenase [Melioribacteraceae bacterium]MCF8264443.1 aminomethyl-transferring glycine dehydrogenase [Melioribacteraceae bacterium]